MNEVLAAMLERIRHTIELNGFLVEFAAFYHAVWDDYASEVQAATASPSAVAYFITKRFFWRNVSASTLTFTLGGEVFTLAAGVTGSFLPTEAEIIQGQLRSINRQADFAQTTLAQFQSSGDATIWTIG